MDADDEYLFVIRAIEDTDPSALWKTARSAPEEIVFQFFGAGLLEAEYFASLRSDAGHYVPYGAIFTGSVHSLEDEQKRMTVGCVVKLLQCAEVLHVLFKQLLILFLRFGQCRYGRGPFAQVQLLAWRHVVGLRIDRHGFRLSLQIWPAANDLPHGLVEAE